MGVLGMIGGFEGEGRVRKCRVMMKEISWDVKEKRLSWKWACVVILHVRRDVPEGT